MIAAGCQAAPRSAAELIPVVLTHALDPHQTGFAFGEVLAHVNYMLRRGEPREEREADGVARYRAA